MTINTLKNFTRPSKFRAIGGWAHAFGVFRPDIFNASSLMGCEGQRVEPADGRAAFPGFEPRVSRRCKNL